jgi:hypothetical protein
MPSWEKLKKSTCGRRRSEKLEKSEISGSQKAHCQKSVSVTILTSTAWRSWVCGGEGALAELLRATRSRPNFGRFVFLYSFVFKILTCGGRKSTYITSQVGVLRDFRRPQMGKMGIFSEETPEQTIPKQRKTRMAKK